MSGGVVLTVGNEMMGDDGAGPLLAELLSREPAAGWRVVDGGSAPENVVQDVLDLRPERVLIVDAADMGMEPGKVCLVDDRAIASLYLITTHNLPLSFLIERLREHVPEVLFLGIQPDLVAFGFPMSGAVCEAVEDLHLQLCEGFQIPELPWLAGSAAGFLTAND